MFHVTRYSRTTLTADEKVHVVDADNFDVSPTGLTVFTKEERKVYALPTHEIRSIDGAF